MPFDLDNLLACLELRRTSDHGFQGDNYDLTYRRVFGGQLLGQGIRALHETERDKEVKSLTLQFTREGDPSLPVDLTVSTVQSGRTFATCTVRLSQPSESGERVIGVLSASLHAPEPGPERWDSPPDVGEPTDAVPRPSPLMPWDHRVVDGVDLTAPEPRAADYRVWLRVPQVAGTTHGERPWLHQALLAHASEPTVIGTALLPLPDVSQRDATVRFTSAVTTHTMWFHGPLRVDDWLLIDQHSPVLRGSRAFGRADVWTADGELVASLAQESMVRIH